MQPLAPDTPAHDLTLHEEIGNVPARGILVALGLCAPFWIGLYLLVF